MDFSKMSIAQLLGFLHGRNVPGTALIFPEEAVMKLRDNYIDGASLLILMEDIQELKELIPNTAHRLQLKRVIVYAQKDLSDVAEDPQVETVSSNCEVASPKDCVPALPVITHVLDVPDYMPLVQLPASPDCGITAPKVTKNSQKKDSSPGLPIELATPDRYSIRVEEAIARNDLLSARTQLIKDAGNFYYSLCKHPKQGDYTRMAKKLCERFPELKDFNEDQYWKSVKNQLSMYFRNQRRVSSKPKGKENVDSKAVLTSTAKKIKLGDDVICNKRNLDLLKTTKESDFSPETYRKLVEETYFKRREFIEKEAGSTKEIICQCPYLSEPSHVKEELQRMLGKEKVKSAPKRIMDGLKSLLKSTEKLDNKDIVSAVAIIGNRMKKGKNTEKIITYQDQTTPPDKLFRSKLVEFRIVCTGTPQNTKQIFICGEGDAIYECPTNCLLDALFNLIACYYVFDVSYPNCLYSSLLFLQDVGLHCVNSSDCRGSKYSSMLTEVKHFTSKYLV